jgi:hypothetical protein
MFGTVSWRWPICTALFIAGYVGQINYPIFKYVFSENVSTAPGIDASAPCYRFSENIRVHSVVVPELKLRNVEGHVLGADFVERANNAALNQRPETFNRVGVNGTDDIFLRLVANETVRKFFSECVVSPQVVSGEQADFVRDGFADEADQRCAVAMLNDPRNDVTLALDCANDSNLAGASATRAAIALVPMAIASLSTDVGFVNFDNASEFVGLVFTEASADAVAHVERGLIRAEAHVAHNLQGAHSLFAGQHKVDDLEPIAERLVRVLKDSADQNREPITTSLGALTTLPVERPIGHGINVNIPASRAMDTFGPAAGHEVILAIILSREHVAKLLICKLFYRLNSGHVGLHQSMEAI